MLVAGQVAAVDQPDDGEDEHAGAARTPQGGQAPAASENDHGGEQGRRRLESPRPRTAQAPAPTSHHGALPACQPMTARQTAATLQSRTSGSLCARPMP
jgi:hypothetical protein